MSGAPAWLRCTPSSTPHPTSPALRSGSATFSHKGEKERRHISASASLEW